MTKDDISGILTFFTERSEFNYVPADKALSPGLAGMKIFDAPLVAIGSAADNLFPDMQKPEAIGEHFILPDGWLPGAKTVISFFFPFTDSVRDSNKKDMSWPSNEWLHGRIEGQELVRAACLCLLAELEHAGYPSVCPVLDSRFRDSIGTKSLMEGREVFFSSNWSERHAAFVCGLGTFGLSKGLITEKGVAGRFGSVISSLQIDADKRNYNAIYEYCSMCGSCAENCPAFAISGEEGKKHPPCSAFIGSVRERHSPWYGCGKCQVNVPCERGIPRRRI